MSPGMSPGEPVRVVAREVDVESVGRETQAMAAVAEALAPLQPDERRRVLDWTVQRFRPPVTRRRAAGPAQGDDS